MIEVDFVLVAVGEKKIMSLRQDLVGELVWRWVQLE